VDSIGNEVNVQYLRREVSARTLALQNLQREHETLLAAYTQQQSYLSSPRPGDWDPTGESRALVEERARLQGQVEALEGQVKDLTTSREDAQKESAASRTQYMQIMSMSSQLQTRTAADMRRWQAEREEWEEQRRSLVQRIRRLERSGEGADASDTGGRDPTADTMDIVLRADVDRLERACRGMETVLREVNDDTGRLDDAIRTALAISANIRTKMREVLSSSSDQEHEMKD
jgi:chromosome segregation ATPase